ncbi:LacI family DNA-binding transcriptional regulator [Paenibacillus radicis (ex Gao et al. 2016)]|uniref:LacI family transcriptional regulator n=1 Tax=Paenibacillus radicis (ex Gao et al. 2016) TaxID=1737354 RepID=A0A917H6E4_9BACL|nr:LacI family DNA-binding transcriptional regulator [Paenibacillus radicis (ex Gao et al. 2016)]GGG68981.1 LacI family transcriptional regulator [Paenibacillus radicis (ex Gao et al. 2016)]
MEHHRKEEGNVLAVNIKDVAEKAGVSISTVSRVLNNGKYVKQEVRLAVQQAIKDLNFVPNSIARSLVRKKTNLIGVIASDISTSFFSSTLSYIEEAASQNRYNILVGNIKDNLDKELKYLHVFKEMQVDGIIVMHEKMNKHIERFLQTLTTPTVFCSAKPRTTVDCPSVNIDDMQASYDTVKHLIALGHRRIAFIGGDTKEISTGRNRYDGYLKALVESGISVNPEWVRFGNFKMKDGYEIMQSFLQGEYLPTVVFAVSDDMAVGALNCIVDHGLKVPDDISVVGFDDSSITETVRPKLTSLHQPIQQIGQMSVDILIKMIEGNSPGVKEVVLSHKLVERDSLRSLL